MVEKAVNLQAASENILGKYIFRQLTFTAWVRWRRVIFQGDNVYKANKLGGTETILAGSFNSREVSGSIHRIL
jgi:hypothetical protein